MNPTPQDNNSQQNSFDESDNHIDHDPNDLSLDDHVNASGAPDDNPVTPLIEDDFIFRPMEDVKKLPLFFRIHITIAISSSLTTFFIWRWTTGSDPSFAPVWWWIYPVFFFAMTLCAHKYLLLDKSYYKGTYILIGLVNAMLFLTNYLMLTGSHIVFPWFIYPLGVSVMACLVIYRFEVPKNYSILKLLTHQYFVLNIILFITWLTTGGFPWFFYPLLVLAYPLLAMYAKQVYNETRFVIFATLLNIDICLITFITWAFTYVAFPWFLFVWGILGTLNFFVWFRKNKLPCGNGIASLQIDGEEHKSDQEEENLYPKI